MTKETFQRILLGSLVGFIIVVALTIIVMCHK